MTDVLTSPHSRLLRLRILVGYLGEKEHFAWWPTSFFDHSSRLFLEPVFPRTRLLAQYHGVVEAARRFHDEHVSVGAFHLFRLPEEMEEDLHASRHGEMSGSTTGAPHDKEAALGELTLLCGRIAQDAAVGPLSIGSVRDVTEEIKLQQIAAIYCASFKSNKQAFPYLLQ